MSDKIYEDSINVSVGRFTVRTNTSKTGWAKGRAIVLKNVGAKPQRFGGMTNQDLVDLHRALSEYMHMMSMSQ